MNEYLYSAAPELMYELDRQQSVRAEHVTQREQKRRFFVVFTITVSLIIAGVVFSYYPALLAI